MKTDRPFEPMLASTDNVTPELLQQLQYPLWGTPKLDGIRALSFAKGRKSYLLSRKLKPIPNMWINEWAEESFLPSGLDGELIVLNENGKPDTFNECQSLIMSNITMPFNWTYYVFDRYDIPNENYLRRLANARMLAHTLNDPTGKIFILTPKKLLNPADVIQYEHECVDKKGFEGVILRSNSPYKFGRSTFNEGWMLKMKRFEDFEAKVIGFEEKMHNGNIQVRDATGKAKRSSHKANMIPMDTLGALVAEDLITHTTFRCSGFTDKLAKHIWDNRWSYMDKIFTATKQIHGQKNKPRAPKFKGFRKD